MRPDLFIRIELRRIAGEFLGMDLRMFCQATPNRSGAIMGVASVPNDLKRTAQVSSQEAEKLDDLFGPDVLIVREHCEVQIPLLASSASCHLILAVRFIWSTPPSGQW